MLLSGIIVQSENHMEFVSIHAMRDHWKVDIYIYVCIYIYTWIYIYVYMYPLNLSLVSRLE